MTTSRHRLTKAKKRVMDTDYPRVDSENAYLAHHAARGSSQQTILRYREMFKLFHRFKPGTLDSRVLTTETMQAFAVWPREPSTKGQRGNTKRSEVSRYGAWKDFRASVRWLQGEELAEGLEKIWVSGF